MKPFKPADIAKRKKAYETARASLNLHAQLALRTSKRAIFAFQRNETSNGGKLLDEASSALRAAAVIIRKQPDMASENTWSAAREEYTEAVAFASFLTGKLALPDEIADDPDAVLGGLADAAGEIARYSVLRATEHDRSSVERGYQTVLQIVDLLASLDLTGNLRSKFDQTKQHLRKIEDIRYDLSI